MAVFLLPQQGIAYSQGGMVEPEQPCTMSMSLDLSALPECANPLCDNCYATSHCSQCAPAVLPAPADVQATAIGIASFDPYSITITKHVISPDSPPPRHT